MLLAPLRWLGRNLSTLLLAFFLALIVWVSAVIAADPNQERTFTTTIQSIGSTPDSIIIGEVPDRFEITLFAPLSILDRVAKGNGALQAWIDLADLEAGTNTVPVQYQLSDDIKPVRIIDAGPENIDITLEALITNTLPIRTEVKGEPSLGYQVDPPVWSDKSVVVKGRSSLVEQVTDISVVLDITGVNKTIRRTLTLVPRDSNGIPVPEVSIDPDQITVTQTVTLLGGYRNMVVKVMTTGQVADGYLQTNITVSPPNVMIFSADPALIDQLPGYVETDLLDLSAAADDIETILAINLPEGINIVGDPNVLVQVGIAAIEGSITVARDVEIIGLLPGLEAQVSPGSVDIIVYGPIPLLETLTLVDVRLVIDLTNLGIGVYQLAPQVEILPDRIRKQAISPETIEVTIIELPTPTPTITPTVIITPTVTVQP